MPTSLYQTVSDKPLVFLRVGEVRKTENMKTLTLLAAGMLLTASAASSQCLDVVSVDWNNSQFSVTVDIQQSFDELILPDGTTITNNALSSVSVDLPIVRSTDILSWVLIDGDEECQLSFDPQENTRYSKDWVDITDPSTCEAADGMLCLNGPQGVLDFSVDGVNSTAGCLGGLEAGSVTFTPAAIMGTDGVVYQNTSATTVLLELEVALVESEGMLVPEINGGSGDYTWFINDSPANTPIPAAFKGCALLDVTDIITGCKAVKTEYLTESLMGDIAGMYPGESHDGCVRAADLLALLGFIGTPGNTPADFDCNGVTGIQDLLFFLTRYANDPCGS